MKKFLGILRTVIVALVVAVSVGMMVFTVISVRTFDRYDRDLFGYKAFIVLSDSMRATDFAAGDLVLVRETDPSTLRAGDVIAYISTNRDNYNEVVTHKIRSLTTEKNGEPGFITYGTTTDTDDEAIVTYPYVIGKYAFHLKGVGTFFNFLRSTPGYICCILIPFLILIGNQGYSTVRAFRDYKSAQMAELRAEREKLEAEREESKRVMEELLELKKQLKQGGAPPGEADAGPDAEAEPQPEAETEAPRKTEPEPELKPGPEPEPEPEAGPEETPEPEEEPAPGSEEMPGPEAGTGTETEKGPEEKPGSEPRPRPEPGRKVRLKVKAKSAPEAGPETAKAEDPEKRSDKRE